MKTKIRFVTSIVSLFIWLVGANAFLPVAYAAPAHSYRAASLSAGNANADPDRDGLTNKQEKACGTNPKIADSNHNGILDGAEDRDRDGLSNRAEFEHHTKCNSRDSDHDGVPDGQEVEHGTNPNKKEKKDGPNHH